MATLMILLLKIGTSIQRLRRCLNSCIRIILVHINPIPADKDVLICSPHYEAVFARILSL